MRPSRPSGMGTALTATRFAIDLPADPAYLSTVRLFASAIARHFGVRDDDIEDLKIAVDEVLAGEVDDGASTVAISMPYNAYLLDADVYADAAAPGIPVIVFAYVAPHAPGGFVAATMEGFMTGCDDGSLLGFVGHLDGWSTMASLDDVIDAVTSPTRES
jgi:hypothetical protein